MGNFASLLDLLFPPRCTFCRRFLKTGESGLCNKCAESLPFTEGEKVFSKGEFYTLCVAPLYYKDSVRDSILRFKFREMSNYAGCYGDLLADCVRQNLSGKYDLISWVPISANRKKTRGYDQSMLLAMATALALDDVAVETLRKHKDVPAQSGLDAPEKRRANILGAYEVVDMELVAGKRILLVDDIVTTGSTLSECAKTLLMAEAGEVFCAALARPE